MLHENLSRLAKEYVYERTKPFAQNEFGNFVRKDIAQEAKLHLMYLPYELTVKSSVGNGQWASVPWLAFFDPLITKSATRGFYIVYLINAQTEEIYLSMNQGTTDVYKEFGEARGQKVLRRRAVDIAERIPEYTKIFDTSPIDLGSDESLPCGYMAGHAFGRKYHSNDINSESFYKDLNDMFSAYETLVNRGGTTPSDTMIEESGTLDIEETRKYVLSRRIERTPHIRKKVLERRTPVCEGCGLDPVVHYNYSGPVLNTPLDVHHAKPIFELAEGESRRYSIPGDFMVLCPTCHRVIHKLNDPSNISELKHRVKFRHILDIDKGYFNTGS